MINRESYRPGPAAGARVEKGPDKWALILVRELRHSPEKVWQALTDPAQLREWAPFEVDGRLDQLGAKENLKWIGAPKPLEARVTRVEAPELLEYTSGDTETRWEVEAFGRGARLKLWTSIDRRFIAMGAAGWHISFDVLDYLLDGSPIGRFGGADIINFEGWKRLHAEYAEQFGVKPLNWPPQAAKES